jgi:hypothetical protein
MKGLEAFRGRSVFITGHTGFKGSWLTIWLNHLGARVSGYSLLPPTNPSNFASSSVRELVARHSNADVRDTAHLQGAIEACQPSVIFHLAAQTLVRQSYLDPRQTYDVNVMGTASLLDSVRKLGRPCVVIIVTSDKCYENHESARRHTETDSFGGPRTPSQIFGLEAPEISRAGFNLPGSRLLGVCCSFGPRLATPESSFSASSALLKKSLGEGVFFALAVALKCLFIDDFNFLLITSKHL